MSSMFSTPKIPAVEKPVVVPVEDGASVNAARRKRAADIGKRSGRVATVLTEQADRLGG